ncbi:MAG: DUF935 domain-containing protein [Candidatus Symbiothrix sp.]|nr:DUF935 domain-containing protein [Candidatus Symbiothrix sp.]
MIPRKNVVQEYGLFYPDYSGDTTVAYRELKEYGTYLLEFNSDHLGLLQKAVTVMLFKKFCMSCWSELCEIYGIPPRYIKTQTQDEGMLQRAEAMMRDMGAAAWFIIDQSEDLQFATGVTTNGDVYKNLIKMCNDEVCLLISGAIIGQDTENGNRSKEQSSIDMLDRLVESDRRMVENYMNGIVLPAFDRLGIVNAAGLTFRFSAVENNEQLWEQVVALLPHKEVDSKWITEKFGIPVSDKYAVGLSAVPSLKERGIERLGYEDFDPFD